MPRRRRPRRRGPPGVIRRNSGGPMDDNRARELLRAERAEAERLLRAVQDEERQNRDTEDEEGVDVDDRAQPLTEQGIDEALAESLQDRLAAIGRAEQRLADGTY